MDENKEIYSLESRLLRYFSGDASQEEIKEIEQWIEESLENGKIAKDVYAIYLASDALHTIRQTNTATALKETWQRTKKRNISLLSWVQRIAAILLIPLLISFAYYVTRKEPVQYVEYRTNPGMIAKVELPDGSNVWLNSSSWVRHPQQFTDGAREVEIEGEAYFEVEKDENKRFIVNTPADLQVEVLGTEFNIEAYPGEPEVKTTLVSGSVKLSFRDSQNRKKERTLKPDEEFTYNTKTKGEVIDQPYIPTLTAWKDGRVILKNTPFEETLKILNKRFNVEFVVKNAKLYDNYFTYTSDSQQLSLFLDAFKISSGIQYRFVEPDKPVSGTAVSPKSIVELY